MGDRSGNHAPFTGRSGGIYDRLRRPAFFGRAETAAPDVCEYRLQILKAVLRLNLTAIEDTLFSILLRLLFPVRIFPSYT